MTAVGATATAFLIAACGLGAGFGLLAADCSARGSGLLRPPIPSIIAEPSDEAVFEAAPLTAPPPAAAATTGFDSFGADEIVNSVLFKRDGCNQSPYTHHHQSKQQAFIRLIRSDDLLETFGFTTATDRLGEAAIGVAAGVVPTSGGGNASYKLICPENHQTTIASKLSQLSTSFTQTEKHC